MLRIFMGLELDEVLRDTLARAVDSLRRRAPKVRWVAAENLHITLKFIGEIPAPDLPELLAAVDEATAASEPFSLEIRGLGLFPDPKRPRVVWAGCGEGREEASVLAARIEDACAHIGYPKERRPYHPHVTLGRVKVPRDAGEAVGLIEAGADTPYDRIEVDHAVVYLSELKRGGAEYSPMHRPPLGQSDRE